MKALKYIALGILAVLGVIAFVMTFIFLGLVP